MLVEVHGNTQDSHLVHSKMERTNEAHETHLIMWEHVGTCGNMLEHAPVSQVYS